MRAAVLLAAGGSRRFGAADKLLASFAGQALVAHAAEALRAAQVDLRIAVVADAEVARHCDGFLRLAPDRAGDGANAGLADSLRPAVKAAQAAGAAGLLVALADMPLVTAAHLDAVVERAARRAAACSGCGDRRMPPAWFDGSLFGTLIGLSGDSGARTILRDLPAAAVVSAPSRMLADIDTAADLAAVDRGGRDANAGAAAAAREQRHRPDS